MGCVNSKQSLCQQCSRPYSPPRRSHSMPARHPSHRKSDNHHVVSLNSTLFGSFKLNCVDQNHLNGNNIDNKNNEGKEFSSMDVTQEKNLSNTIKRKIPKTPTRTPPGEPETINTWEMMEGLEEDSHPPQSSLVDPFSPFHVVPDPTPFDHSKPTLQENVTTSPKPMWLQIAATDSITNSKSIISDFDMEIISTFRKALEELTPSTELHLQENEKIVPIGQNPLFSKNIMNTKNVNGIITTTKCPPYGENKVVIYFTSLRGVRKTYEDCYHVRMILKGMSVRIDERDVSMHYQFRAELKELLGGGFSGGLPRVFVNGRYIGGFDEVQQMHEDGDLEKVLEGCEEVEEVGGGGSRVCEVCGDVRFVLCEKCLGSCKIYYEGDEDREEGVGGFQRCLDCNENGIIRCSICCY